MRSTSSTRLLPLTLFALALPAAAAAQSDNCPEGSVGHCGWAYRSVAGSQCRLADDESRPRGEGARGGIAVRKSAQPSDTLFITLQGGGACTNLTTCLAGADSFNASDFNHATDPGDSNAVTHLMSGIWNRTDASSVVGKFNHVYIPYCSGDMFAGDAVRTNWPVLGTTSYFHGWKNAKAYYEDIVNNVIPGIEAAQPGLPIRRVVFGGFSAGGYGAVLTLPQMVRAISAANKTFEVVLVNDSAPFFDNGAGDKLWASCFQQTASTRFNFAGTFLQECRSCRSDSFFAPWQDEVLAANPKINYAFSSSTDDLVVRTFMSDVAFATCSGTYIPTHEAEFIAGLNAIRSKLTSTSVETTARHAATYFQSYNGSDDLWGSTKHVFIHNGAPATTSTAKGTGYFYPYVGTTSVKNWLENFLAAPTSTASSRHVGNCALNWYGYWDCK